MIKIFMVVNKMRRGKPEILAPAGTYEAMEAAVKAGCDAVYAGGSLFSARAYAGNFDETSFLEMIDYCHLFGVKVYMTLNTLLKEEELKQLPSYIKPYYQAGLDAVLVQDMGVFRVLHENFPDLPIHASTQMSIASTYGAEFAKRLGMERIVPARELSLEEIRSIKKQTDIEIETFVHGAMCFAYSGKCLFSSFAGGRSGNRGRCAQPCRRFYELQKTGEKQGDKLAAEYLLSLKDLCLLKDLPLLIDAGIDSFKIEGRMKNAYYVASAVSAYRTLRDLYLELKENEQEESFDRLSENAQRTYQERAELLQEELAEVYNRGGFYNGYYFTDKGKEMSALKRPNHQGIQIGTITGVKPPKINVKLIRDLHRGDVIELRGKGVEIELTSGEEGRSGNVIQLNGKDLKHIHPGMEVWRTRNEGLLKKIEDEILASERKITAACLIEARVGKPLKIRLTAPGAGREGTDVSVFIEGEEVEPAGKAPTTEEALAQKLKKSSGTGIGIAGISYEMDENAFIRMSAFNALRRDVMEKLKSAIAAEYHRS